MAPRIALVHAVTAAMEPVADAFARLWPQAELVNLLDDALAPDRDRDGVLTTAMSRRIGALTDYAIAIGSRGILFTCSAFGEAIEAASRRVDVPVLKPNEAMFEKALETGRNIAMLATFQPSVAPMQAEFDALTRSRRSPARLTTVCIPEAMAALRGGDTMLHNRLLAEAASKLPACDALMLAQFSTSRAVGAVSSVVDCPVLTSPECAVAMMRSRLRA